MYRALAESILEFQSGLAHTNRAEDRSTAATYLAALAPLLARATLGDDILRDIPTVERLFGTTWIIDDHPFENAFTKWREFVSTYSQHALGGMTVNERLVAMNLLDDFDAASKRHDTATIRDILRRLYLDESSIEAILRRTNDA